MNHRQESMTDITDPGNNSARKMRADRMLHAIEYGLDIAREIADQAADDPDAGTRQDALFRIIWAIDRTMEGARAASDFVGTHWPD